MGPFTSGGTEVNHGHGLHALRRPTRSGLRTIFATRAKTGTPTASDTWRPRAGAGRPTTFGRPATARRTDVPVSSRRGARASLPTISATPARVGTANASGTSPRRGRAGRRTTSDRRATAQRTAAPVSSRRRGRAGRRTTFGTPARLAVRRGALNFPMHLHPAVCGSRQPRSNGSTTSVPSIVACRA